ncbi:MAG: hypothetical protein VXZ73_01235 [Pseudomonadota bacterium]|nr:hypothetical protein [Pseudomonadota bacterium]
MNKETIRRHINESLDKLPYILKAFLRQYQSSINLYSKEIRHFSDVSGLSMALNRLTDRGAYLATYILLYQRNLIGSNTLSTFVIATMLNDLAVDYEDLPSIEPQKIIARTSILLMALRTILLSANKTKLDYVMDDATEQCPIMYGDPHLFHSTTNSTLMNATASKIYALGNGVSNENESVASLVASPDYANALCMFMASVLILPAAFRSCADKNSGPPPLWDLGRTLKKSPSSASFPVKVASEKPLFALLLSLLLSDSDTTSAPNVYLSCIKWLTMFYLASKFSDISLMLKRSKLEEAFLSKERGAIDHASLVAIGATTIITVFAEATLVNHGLLKPYHLVFGDSNTYTAVTVAVVNGAILGHLQKDTIRDKMEALACPEGNRKERKDLKPIEATLPTALIGALSCFTVDRLFGSGQHLHLFVQFFLNKSDGMATQLEAFLKCMLFHPKNSPFLSALTVASVRCDMAAPYRADNFIRNTRKVTLCKTPTFPQLETQAEQQPALDSAEPSIVDRMLSQFRARNSTSAAIVIKRAP